MRRNQLWTSQFQLQQWQFVQGRRDLLPTFNEVAMARAVARNFTRFRSFASWWGQAKAGFRPAFVEFVEEQRAKATPAAG